MVDTYDLFKKLGCGAKFDLKRFNEDASKFQVIIYIYIKNVDKPLKISYVLFIVQDSMLV